MSDTLLALAMAGLGLFLGYGATTDDWDSAARYGPPVLGYVAPVRVLTATARLVYGLAPRRMLLAGLPSRTRS
ncbi:hypothetical protein DVA67_034160 [Solirubrobacter sp. CPCC 204708]|uniref:DoxX family protein n=1 Tax=Solirubrobacter deserti TaxID=2282478 RepID=A0ABT4RW77_9ACTN|nr:hypothetical protein [Solirubrobacter deserti]MBE2321043.1 hypothetical protein [Solirubrobacter deserti]MDA0142495.1 hypothetical protein [Solirubrobacter deserti]